MIDGSYFLDDFHEEADGDDYAPAFMRFQQDMNLWETRELLLTRTLYRFSTGVDVIRPFLTLRALRPGNSTGNALGIDAPIPTVWFSSGGFTTHYPGSYSGGTYGSVVVPADATARGDFFQPIGFNVAGPGSTDGSTTSNGYAGSVDDHAFRFRAQGRMTGVAIKGFRGSGIYINASSGSTAGNIGNANNSLFQDVSIYNCGGPGVYVSGGDANVISFRAPFTIVECGLDMKSRTNTFTRILVGQHMHMVTISAAANSTLYRLVVSGNNADYTSDSSATLSEIAAGLAAAVNALALANIFAQQVDDDRVLVYSTNSASFTCTESSANMSITTTAATTTPASAYCVGGSASTDLRLGDTVSCSMPSESWRGFLRGDVVDMPDGYGYAEVDLGLERTGYGGTSISNVSGSTWQMLVDARSWTGPEHALQNIEIFGAANEANNGTFPIANIVAGVYGASSVRLRVSYAVNGAEYWVLIRGNTAGAFTRVAITAASASTGSIRDQLVTAIGAAGISGVSVAATSSADLTITCTGVIAAPGPRMDNVDGTARTIIEYTNAAGVADSSFDGTWMIDARVGLQGAYAPVGGALVRGRGTQVQDQPLIEGRYEQVLINGATDGDGWVAKGGRSIFDQCYTEGTLPAISSAGGALFHEGSMYPGVAQKAQNVDQTHYVMTPAVVAAFLDPARSGAVYGRIGDEVYSNCGFGWGRVHANTDDIRMFFEQTAQGDGAWEMLHNESAEAAILRIANMRDARIGIGSMATGQPGLFLNYANGALRSPRSAIPDGDGTVTYTTEGDTGAIGYIEAPRISGTVNCAFECIRVYPISGITNASHASVTIGTHNLPSGTSGRVIVRNVQGMTGVNGDRQWTRNASSSIFLETTGGANLDTTASGTYTSATGIAILCRLVALVRVTGTSLSMADGTWVVGDRAVNLNPVVGDGVEWICTASGAGGAATWAVVSSRVATQPAIQFRDEGVNQGSAGGVTTVDFVGTGVSAVASGGTLTVTIGSGGGGLTFQQALAISTLRL